MGSCCAIKHSNECWPATATSQKSAASLTSLPTRRVASSAAIVNSLGLIAGNGIFPLEVAKASRRRGLRIVAIAHRGETAETLAPLVDEITWIKVGELERMIEVLKLAGVQQAAMAGGISRARLADSFAPDARALTMLSRIGRLSDDAVLRG